MFLSCRRPLFTAALLAALGASSRAEAEAEEAIVVDGEGVVSCTNADDFFARVQARAIGARRARLGEAARRFVFDIDQVGLRMRGLLVVRQLDGRSTRREVTGESCDEVADALALITALD